MQFKPKTEKELKEAMLWPAGEYDFEIVKAESATSGPNSKSPGTPYIKLIARIFNNEGGERMLNALLHPNMEYQLYQFCNETGLADKYESGQLTPLDCEGKAGKVEIKVTPENGSFPAKNEVKRWGLKEKKANVNQPTPSPEPPQSDDVPF